MADCSWPDACIAWECERERAFLAPFCVPHLLDAWRWVEARPEVKPTMPPKLVRKARRDAASMLKPPTKPVVYYFRMPDGRIKIGTSTQLSGRAATLGVEWPDGVLAVEWGGVAKEAARHAQFAEHRHYNGSASTEIFAPVDALMQHIAAVRAKNGDPQALLDEQIRIYREWDAEQRQAARDHEVVQQALNPNAPRRT